MRMLPPAYTPLTIDTMLFISTLKYQCNLI
nr:MAG TPA: hypothetical protein [Caudoviricetes sp.]